MDTNKIFAFYLENGIITLDSLANMSKEETMSSIINKVHKYKITVHTDGRYQTYVPDPSKPGGRRQIRKKTIEEMNDFLLEYYTLEIKASGKNFESLYFEWVDYKKKFCTVKNIHKGLSPSTIRRYERDYDNHLKGTKLSKLSITNVTPIVVENILGDLIDEQNISESSASNILGYIRQAFAYGKRAGYLRDNPCEYVDRRMVLSKCKVTPRTSDCDRVLTLSELGALKTSVIEHEKEYPYYMPDYAIELAMMTGMRVGEIAVLRWSAIDDGYIHVDESEHRYDYSDRPSELVIGEPKNQKHRLIPLTEEMRDLFERIESLDIKNPEDFIFVRREDLSRYTGHDISCAVDRRAAEAGIKKTSIHGIRRTVSSILRTKLPVKTVANMLGHLETTNERHYNYDFFEDSAKIKALSELSSTVLKFPEKIKEAEAR